MNSNDSLKNAKRILVLALLLIFIGGLLAWWIQTGGNTIKIKDVRFAGSNGKLNSALLYIPPGVTNKTPAPGIVATHGYINSRETHDGFAIEFARRGYVVLCPDQSGHGFSDPPAFGNGFGGMDTLKYFRTLDIVDPKNIGLEGHSMGGWASTVAASVNPDGYQSFLYASSSPGTYGVAEGTPTFPRNAAIIFSLYDEFSGLMWKTPIPSQVGKTEKMKKMFNTTEDIQVGKLYGSIQDGTARKLYSPAVIHPRVHFNAEGIAAGIDWFQLTLKGGKNLPPSDQVWQWKELGNFIALIGMILLLFPVGVLLLNTNFFKELSQDPPERKSASGIGWWIGALITTALPIPLFIWAYGWSGKGIAKASWLWPQNITTTIMYWLLVLALVSLVLFLIWHFVFNKNAAGVNYGLTWKDKGVDWMKIWKSFLLAVLICFAGYLTLSISFWIFKTDYRLWVFAIKPMTALQFRIFLSYLIPLAVFYLVLALCLHGQLRIGKDGEETPFWKEAIVNIVVLILGYFVIEMYHYLPLFAGGALGVAGGSLWFIVMFQFFPIFAIIGLVSTYFFRKTGHIYTGAFLSAMLVTWIVVAGQATHFPFP
jgi:pimeloyl-ACP methyl ester carboxylesterase